MPLLAAFISSLGSPGLLSLFFDSPSGGGLRPQTRKFPPTKPRKKKVFGTRMQRRSQATRRATSREDYGGHESERRDPAAGDRCEEVHRGDVQVPGPGLAGPEEEEEPSRTRTQAEHQPSHPGEPAIYIIYILRERERKQKGCPVVVVLGNGGLDTSYTWTRSPLPPSPQPQRPQSLRTAFHPLPAWEGDGTLLYWKDLG